MAPFEATQARGGLPNLLRMSAVLVVRSEEARVLADVLARRLAQLDQESEASIARSQALWSRIPPRRYPRN